METQTIEELGEEILGKLRIIKERMDYYAKQQEEPSVASIIEQA